MRILNIIGRIDIDTEFDRIFDINKKFLITPSLGSNHYFEMSGESMYNCLLNEEIINNKDYGHLKKEIINALLNRRNACNGFYLHKSLKGNDTDTQLRSTSSIIRTLLLGYRDNLIDRSIIEDVIYKHFQYYLDWGEGVWFCHDTSEYNNSGPKTHIKVDYLSKDSRNTVTLNTHFDSMTTLGIVLNENIIEDNEDLINLYNRGLKSINKVLEKEKQTDKIDSLFQKIDKIYVNKLFNSNRTYIDKLYSRILHPIMFKILKPTLFFKNGFIGRDLAVMNIHVDYLLVNIVDILRFLKSYNHIGKKTSNILKQDLINIVHNAVDLVHNAKGILNYIQSDDLQKAWYVEMLYLYQDYSDKYIDAFLIYKKENLYNYKHLLLD